MNASTQWIAQNPSNYFDGQWHSIAGDEIQSKNPANPAQVVWSGTPDPAHVDGAVAAARTAFTSWRQLSQSERAEHLLAFSAACKKFAEPLAQVITLEMGKTIAESRGEVKLLSDKIDITLQETTLARKMSGSEAILICQVGICAAVQ